MDTWLLVDTTYIAHRAKHSTGSLTYENMATGVAFGVLRDIEMLTERFHPSRVLLAFDHPEENLRRKLLPSYKTGRLLRKTDHDKEMDALFYPQLDRLIAEILPGMGFKNVLQVPGYEADDIIAYYAEHVAGRDDMEAIIASADGDMWQCIRSNVLYFNVPKGQVINEESFKEAWGIGPEVWPWVKALAGCGTDDVPGIDGIGEKTAAQWFAGTLSPGTEKKPAKKYTAIATNLAIIEKNLPLVKLPFPGLDLGELRSDRLTPERKEKVLDSLGIRSERVQGRPVEVIPDENDGFLW